MAIFCPICKYLPSSTDSSRTRPLNGAKIFVFSRLSFAISSLACVDWILALMRSF